MQFYRMNAGMGRPTAFGGYLVSYGTPGVTPPDMQKITLARYRNDFSLAWAPRRYNFFNGQQELNVGLLTTAEACFLGFYSDTRPRTNFSVAKTDTAGNLLWVKAYGWQGDFVADMKFTRQGHILLVGYTQHAQQYDLKFLLINQQGDSLNSLRFAPLGPGRTVTTPEVGRNLFPLTDGGFLVLTSVDSVNRPNIPLAVKVDAQLRPVWTRVERYVPPRSFGAIGQYGDALELADGSVLVLFSYNNTPAAEQRPFYLLRLDGATGQLLQRHELRSAICNRVEPFQLVADGDSAAYVLGACTAGPGGAFVAAPYAARVSLRGLPAVVTAAVPPRPAAEEAAGLGRPYPNPAAGAVRVPYRRAAGTGPAAVQLLDALGRRVRRVPVPAAPGGTLALPLAGLAAGLYWLRFEQAGAPVGPGRRLVVKP
ncbi:hypothetical protein EJV47_12595 [Hymenobacter gummosus]|uniref:T9SS type A sorting domain-containing protein n=2 Tax=Hymenobacter gummosus TaxID=1776032 RepID=A0A3S0K5B8_9BACT|nr:hypothetical protein EJV47_12595 [Hymenobacter gummosus]